MSDKVLVSTVYKETPKPNIKKQPTQMAKIHDEIVP